MQHEGQGVEHPGRVLPGYPHTMSGRRDHPLALSVLVLGVSVAPPAALVAWILGSRALRQIKANPGTYGGRDHVIIGRILGMLGTIAWGLMLLLILYFVVTGPEV